MTNIPPSKNNNNSNAINWVIRIITLAFIAQFYMSSNLWFPNDRSYPTIPLLSSLDFELGQLLTSLLSALFIFFLVLSSIRESLQRYSLLAAFFCYSILLLEDINRFQAWVYIYLAFLAIICWHKWKFQQANSLLNLKFILAMVYFWTGIQKLNVQFITDVYPWLAKIFETTKGLAAYPSLGYSIGILEMLIGLLLLSQHKQKLGVFLAVLLHIGILILLIKDEWNSVVYPWNVAMILLLMLLFKSSDVPSISRQNLPNFALLILFGIVPFLDFFQLSPHCLALGMYSGTSIECDLIINDEGTDSCVPKKLQDNLLFKSDRQSILSLDDWGMEDLNIPPFASERVYQAVAKEFCVCSAPHGGFIELYIPQRWKDEDQALTISCQALLKK
ncbi:hypothetical protein [Aureispira anguillae]|uniref:Uncharacterized protein n=1 Tax=Aureispira anguillae TaxID=2864201 RepID=A0A915YFD4_9BACT|nr:hypothetical protein [Aureispira anguillae]BDS12015.1 hypothetical protein AsAng_0027300 [Aureispira anguillae]